MARYRGSARLRNRLQMDGQRETSKRPALSHPRASGHPSETSKCSRSGTRRSCLVASARVLHPRSSGTLDSAARRPQQCRFRAKAATRPPASTRTRGRTNAGLAPSASRVSLIATSSSNRGRRKQTRPETEGFRDGQTQPSCAAAAQPSRPVIGSRSLLQVVSGRAQSPYGAVAVCGSARLGSPQPEPYDR